MAAVVVATVFVSEGLAVGLIPVATGLRDLLQGLEPCYRAHTHRCKAVVVGDGSWLQGLVTG